MLPLRHVVVIANAVVRYRTVRRTVSRHPRTSDIVVVAHVYYPELWAAIRARLQLLVQPYDLVVTVSSPSSRTVADEIARATPGACVVRVPNLGRDVLPFVQVSRALGAGTVVLKLHTKRSTHADDGAEFFESCLRELIPSPELVAETRELLTTGNASVVGPASRYYPALIHVWHNIADLRRQLRRWKVTDGLEVADLRPLGFFAGTMFWARLDDLRPCFDVRIRDFQIEHGQIDGTMAHALERLFCLVPELSGLPVWASDENDARPQAYDDATWPEWAVRRAAWE